VIAAITAVLIAAMGALMLAFPMIGMLAMTSIITGYLIFAGVLKSIYAFQLKPLHGWGWMLFSGGVSFVLGLMLLYRLPVSALYVLGLFVGVDLVVYGASEIGVALFWRKLTQSA